ncbi:gamma carbonic anhydrase 1, mitochondrial-like [Durio zibethinus]|uniref:Gamma carbonic anhydrase 1, mitochondrial-like n=1 Tax=Durio zibethinus TaxID=66656 RepID=A0A6P5ZIN0_DURZI|nr:gamma carbonic anhydrase 1, mitochondrial-like [Durio zibethinus]
MGQSAIETFPNAKSLIFTGKSSNFWIRTKLTALKKRLMSFSGQKICFRLKSCTNVLNIFKQCDVNYISIGSGTNIQNNSLVHVAKSNLSGKVLPTIVGSNVTVGHSAVLHGCTIEDEAFVCMGAILLDGVYVEKHAMVAAGALVRQNTRIPCGEVWGGNPAKFLRKLTEEEMAFISQSALKYSKLTQVHAAENTESFDEIEFQCKKFARRNEEYDSVLGVVRETPPELILPNNIIPDKVPKTA